MGSNLCKHLDYEDFEDFDEENVDNFVTTIYFDRQLSNIISKDR